MFGISMFGILMFGISMFGISMFGMSMFGISMFGNLSSILRRNAQKESGANYSVLTCRGGSYCTF